LIWSSDRKTESADQEHHREPASAGFVAVAEGFSPTAVARELKLWATVAKAACAASPQCHSKNSQANWTMFSAVADQSA